MFISIIKVKGKNVTGNAFHGSCPGIPVLPGKASSGVLGYEFSVNSYLFVVTFHFSTVICVICFENDNHNDLLFKLDNVPLECFTLWFLSWMYICFFKHPPVNVAMMGKKMYRAWTSEDCDDFTAKKVIGKILILCTLHQYNNETDPYPKCIK